MLSCKAITTISTIKGYAYGACNNGLELDEFTRKLQAIEEGITSNPVSWLVTPGKAVYKIAWGAPLGGENVFILQADYTEYDTDINIDKWKQNIINHIQLLKEYFEQSTVRITFIEDTDTIILK